MKPYISTSQPVILLLVIICLTFSYIVHFAFASSTQCNTISIKNHVDELEREIVELTCVQNRLSNVISALNTSATVNSQIIKSRQRQLDKISNSISLLVHESSFLKNMTLPTSNIVPVKVFILNISTIAGNGVSGYSGDGGLAINAQLDTPYGVAVNAMGEVFIADASNNRIRKVSNNGIITTIAGNGVSGYSGDGGLAINAQLATPYGVAVNAMGEVFIAERHNHCIRKVANNGIITTIAGNGAGGYSGDGGLAINAQLTRPGSVAVNAMGEVFIAELPNHCVRKIANNGIITTIAGNGGAGYSGDGGLAINANLKFPTSLAVNAMGEVFIADSYNHCIRKVDNNGIITTIAGNGVGGYSGDGGLAINANLDTPYGVAVNAMGEILITDSNNHRIRKVYNNGTITTISGTGAGYSGDGGLAINANLNTPYGVAVNAIGEVLIADQANNRIRKITETCTGQC